MLHAVGQVGYQHICGGFFEQGPGQGRVAQHQAQKARVSRLIAFLAACKGIHRVGHVLPLDGAGILIQAVLQAMELQVTAKVVRRLLQVAAVQVKAHGVHARLQGHKAGGAPAAERIQHRHGLLPAQPARGAQGQVDQHAGKHRAGFALVLEHLGQVAGQIVPVGVLQRPQ